jgi:transposase
VVVAVDVGKATFAVSATDAGRTRLFGPADFAMTGPGLAQAVGCVRAVLPAGEVEVRVGIEAAGHYHRPLLTLSAWPAGWRVLQLNPAHVAEQRRVQGRRRVKTDAIDLDAITELVLAGRGDPVGDRDRVITELVAWSAHRTRRVATRTATKNQLLGQLDRSFVGLTLALPDVLGTKVGRLVAAEFADPRRLASLGTTRFIRFAGTRGLLVRRPVAERLVTAARDALAMPDGTVARHILAADLDLLADLDAQIDVAETQLETLVASSPFAPLTTVPGWGTVRAASYGAAIGDPSRWPGHRQLYRASGLSPAQYESAGRRRDGSISREGSVQLRRALIDLGIGLWQSDPTSKVYAAGLRERGKKGAVIACALAHRANKIAYALVRDQTGYDATRWGDHTRGFLDRRPPAAAPEPSTSVPSRRPARPALTATSGGASSGGEESPTR